MDKLRKLLASVSGKDRQRLMDILAMVESGNVDSLDIKKLSGHKDIYRVRKGKFRVLILKTDTGWMVVSVERRNDNTY